VDFLHSVAVHAQQVLGVDAVGILLADNHGDLNVFAAASEQARVLELFQLQNAEGPCLDCYRSGKPTSCADLSAAADRWPRFVPQALGTGFAAVHALPMRLREKTIGGMNLFTVTPGGLDAELLSVAQALTDVVLVQQLQAALNNRLAVEQAKGILAERAGITVDAVFELLQAYAHTRDQKLTDVAEALVRRDPAVDDVVPRIG